MVQVPLLVLIIQKKKKKKSIRIYILSTIPVVEDTVVNKKMALAFMELTLTLECKYKLRQ